MTDYIKISIIGILIIFLQSFVLQQVDLGFWSHPMPYIWIFLILPINANRFGLLFLAFFVGTFVDLLSGSFGSHAASCIVLAFAKHFIDTRFVDFESLQLQGESYVNVNSKSWTYYTYYSLTLIFIHHVVFFSLDFFSLFHVVNIMTSALVSTLLTFVGILLYKQIFNK